MGRIIKDVLHSHTTEKGLQAGRVQTVDSSYEGSSVLLLHCSALFSYCVTHDDPGLPGLNFTSTRTSTLLALCPVPQPQHDALCLVFFVYPNHVMKS